MVLTRSKHLSTALIRAPFCLGGNASRSRSSDSLILPEGNAVLSAIVRPKSAKVKSSLKRTRCWVVFSFSFSFSWIRFLLWNEDRRRLHGRPRRRPNFSSIDKPSCAQPQREHSPQVSQLFTRHEHVGVHPTDFGGNVPNHTKRVSLCVSPNQGFSCT